jgi:glutaconate CoA-transferase, subunit A
VTVEEVVDDFDAPGVRGPGPREPVVILPAWTVSAVCVVPGGAHPSYASGYSQRDNAFYTAWEEVSRDRNAFGSWMQRHVMDVEAGDA